MRLNLKTRKQSHVKKVRDHIFTLHRKLTEETLDIHELKAEELEQKVETLQLISKRMRQYQKYLNLLLL